MRCPICKGNMKKVESKMKNDNVNFEAYECEKCKERLVDMDQLKDLADKYRKLREAKSVKFAKWGNSLAVRIPHDFADDFNLNEGKHGLLTKVKGGFKIVVE